MAFYLPLSKTEVIIMKAVQIESYGGSQVIKINNAERPTLTEGHIIVEVKAAGVNPVDWKIREGYLKGMMTLNFPATLGGDFSGVVVEADGKQFKKGDEVFGQAGLWRGGSGSFAEFAAADINTVSLKPKKVNHVEAAALPLAAVSAYQVLVEHIKLSKGKKILIHGGAGGIGTFAIQIAKNVGAYVSSTAATQDLEYVKDLGADEVIDYKKQAFETTAKDYDAVFDTVGGETYTKSFTILKNGGIIVSMVEQANEGLMKQYGVTSIGQYTQINPEVLGKIAGLVENGVLKVHVDKTFPLEKTAEALDYLQNGNPKGKVVIKLK